jgi:histone-lysine N-methyltransferase SETMAR
MIIKRGRSLLGMMLIRLSDRPISSKTIFTIFFHATGEFKIAIIPEGQKMNRTYFIKCVLCPLTEICYPQGRRTHERRVMLYFDNAPVHNTEAVQESLANVGFRRMEHPPYSPDLAPCDFSLFGAMKQAFAGRHFDTIDDLFMDVEAFLGGLSADSLQTVFPEWVPRLQLCREGSGNYIE